MQIGLYLDATNGFATSFNAKYAMHAPPPPSLPHHHFPLRGMPNIKAQQREGLPLYITRTTIVPSLWIQSLGGGITIATSW